MAKSIRESAVRQQACHYRVRWKPHGYQPGMNPGRQAGMGDHLRGRVLLRDYPDPRRLDLRATLRDVFDRLWVRNFHLNTALKVVVLLDASASMGFLGQQARWQVAEDIVAQIARAAFHAGDAFGLYTANQRLLQTMTLPLRVQRSAYVWVQQAFKQHRPQGASASGLMQASRFLPAKSCLVFIVSDFKWPAMQLQALLKNLRGHDVVPLVLRDPSEMAAIPTRGMTVLQDMETGQKRFVWLSGGLRDRLIDHAEQHQKEISAACLRYGIRPLQIEGQFEPMQFNHYFLSRG